MLLHLRLDRARKLLARSAPSARGLRSVVLNTRTGRRKYWISDKKQAPHLSGKKRTNATQLGIDPLSLKVPNPELITILSGKDSVHIVVKHGLVDMFVNEETNASEAKADRPVQTAMKIRDAFNNYFSRLKDNTLLYCTAYDDDPVKARKKESIYQSSGFGERLDKYRTIAGVIRNGELHPVDKKWASKHDFFTSDFFKILDEEGYDRHGFGSDGYTREGYDRRGFNREGYDQSGYDRNGLDRDGNIREEIDPSERLARLIFGV